MLAKELTLDEDRERDTNRNTNSLNPCSPLRRWAAVVTPVLSSTRPSSLSHTHSPSPSPSLVISVYFSRPSARSLTRSLILSSLFNPCMYTRSSLLTYLLFISSVLYSSSNATSLDGLH
jgi:hypothetical protein